MFRSLRPKHNNARLTVWLSALIMAPYLIIVPSPAHAAPLIGTPGFWQTTFHLTPATGQSLPSGLHMPKGPETRCIGEDNAGWVYFTQWSTLPSGPHCVIANLKHDTKTLDWDIQCQNHTNAHGHILFDTNRHYTGEADIQKIMQGHSMHYLVHAEGQRISACTTAAD